MTVDQNEQKLTFPVTADGLPIWNTYENTVELSVLKTVGQACEAHGVVYWTAASVGQKYQVGEQSPPPPRYGHQRIT
eukprot:scaffold61489_cov20-Prasinocladus_malaysianus.AAC.1